MIKRKIKAVKNFFGSAFSEHPIITISAISIAAGLLATFCPIFYIIISIFAIFKFITQ